MFPKSWSASDREPSFVAQPVTEVEGMFVRGVTLKQEWVIDKN